MNKEQIIGTWKLISWETRSADETVRYPLGKDPIGYIFYNEDDYMSVEIMASGRTPFAAQDLFGSTQEEGFNAIKTYLSYCGKYEVKSDKVIHHIEVCSFPNWIGKAQERIAELKGNRLLLSTRPMMFHDLEQTAHLIWQRI